MVENSSVAQKHTSGEAPKVCSVCTIAWSQPAASRPSLSSQPTLLASAAARSLASR